MDQTNETRLGSAPLGKLLFQLGLPGVAAQVINVLYNIVDRIYIGNIPGTGDMALTGVGVTLPVIMVISAFSAFVGMGGAPLASIRLGAQDHEGAQRILGSCIISLISLSVILMAVFLAFQRPLLFAFGASENVIGYAQDYLTIYLFGTLFVQLALGLNTFISAQGKAKTAMLSVLIGAVLNIVLDPLFIFVFDMGVRGAALATIISQAASAAWVVSFLLGKRTAIPVRKKYLRFDWRIIGQVVGLGVSPFIMQATESLVTITLNSGLQAYGGDLYVGSMTHPHKCAPADRYADQWVYAGGTADHELLLRRGRSCPRAANLPSAVDSYALLFRSCLLACDSACPSAGPPVQPQSGADRFNSAYDAGLFGRDLDLRRAACLPGHFSSAGAGKDIPLPCAAQEGDPACAAGARSAALFWRNGDLFL